jgi:hypothetical protein
VVSKLLVFAVMRAFISAVVLLLTTTATRADTVVCSDGTQSTSSGRGACSHHGGVASEAQPDATKKTPKAANVRCEDGTTSVAGRGACSHHGGVQNEPPARTEPRADTERAPKSTENVRCEDGTTSIAGRGACSHHGGVQGEARTRADRRADNQTERIPTPERAPGQATARCNDGTYSYSLHHRGACSHHDGVATWLTN